VWAQPLGELVLAMPYRNRQTVNVVSVPPAVLNFAKQRDAKFWVVRLDSVGECYALPLAEVEHQGWLKSSDGRPEWFVPLSHFRRIAWQDWPFVERVITLDTVEPPGVHQLSLYQVAQ